MLDVVIVGGGPAGLNAALILGRCRRRVLLLDAGRPRNACSWRVGGFLSRDGIEPMELRRIAREQLAPYETVSVRDVEVTQARRIERGFEVTLQGGERVASRKLLLAPGVTNGLPELEGLAELWGSGVYNCPYCDGFEHRDELLTVYGPGGTAVGLALELVPWSRDILLLTDGPPEFKEGDRERLERNRIRVDERRIAGLEADGKRLARIRFREGEPLPCRALFFVPTACNTPRLVEELDVDLTKRGTAQTDSYERTDIPGLYVAGDASRRVQFAIVAAAEGAMAAFSINTELTEEDTA